jgi:nucleoside-diphosphate-sugar epimerase
VSDEQHVLVTGGAGYIGAALTGELLRRGIRVTVIDSLLFGGESLLAFGAHPLFHFVKGDVTEPRCLRDALPRGISAPQAVFHLAGIVGFPACQAVGKQAAWRYNVEATKNVFEQARGLGVARFVYASTYSNYSPSVDNSPLTEESPLNPQSLYAETKTAAEQFLLDQTGMAITIFRLATLYGLAPRPRFDLLVNQFVLDAYARRELLIYQRAYSRSFLHVRDAVNGLLLALNAPARTDVFNLGAESGNLTKDEIVALVIKRLPETVVTYKNLTFGGDARDLRVSFEKIRRELGFAPSFTVDDGVREVVHALRTGLIREPGHERYRNARFIVQ